MARKWYAISIALKHVSNKAFDALELLLGRRPSKSLLSSLRKVGKWPKELGELLDDIGAPWALYRWVAHAKTADERDERARQSVAALLDKRATRTHPDQLAKVVCRDHFKPRKAA